MKRYSILLYNSRFGSEQLPPFEIEWAEEGEAGNAESGGGLEIE